MRDIQNQVHLYVFSPNDLQKLCIKDHNILQTKLSKELLNITTILTHLFLPLRCFCLAQSWYDSIEARSILC